MRREQKTVIAFELHWQHVVVKDLVHRRARRQRVGEVCETAERVPHAALNAICEDHELQLSVRAVEGRGPDWAGWYVEDVAFHATAIRVTVVIMFNMIHN